MISALMPKPVYGESSIPIQLHEVSAAHAAATGKKTLKSQAPTGT
jgi:hypothetical protein